MKKDGKGGDSTGTGLRFEGKVDFLTLIEEVPGYTIRKALVGKEILFENRVYATCFKKYKFYEYLKNEGVKWNDLISKRLLPDDAILVICSGTLFIIEVKYQQVEGSVDEKLQTCDFKLKQYTKLVSPLNLKVEYLYVLNDWFKKPGYKDVLDYIISVGCHYEFNELPLARLGLPTKEEA